MWASRLRFGSTEAAYFSGEEKSRFQNAARRSTDLSISPQQEPVDAVDQFAR